MAPNHKKILRNMSEHFDDLKVRRPDIYEDEERHLAKDEIRLGNEVAAGPLMPPGIQRLEKKP